MTPRRRRIKFRRWARRKMLAVPYEAVVYRGHRPAPKDFDGHPFADCFFAPYYTTVRWREPNPLSTE